MKKKITTLNFRVEKRTEDKMPRKQPAVPVESSDDSEGSFEVEAILDKRFLAGQVRVRRDFVFDSMRYLFFSINCFVIFYFAPSILATIFHQIQRLR